MVVMELVNPYFGSRKGVTVDIFLISAELAEETLKKSAMYV